MFEDTRIRFERIHFPGRERKVEELTDAMFFQKILKRFVAVRDALPGYIPPASTAAERSAHILRDNTFRFVELAHVHGDIGRKLTAQCGRSAQGNQTAAAVFDPELFCLAGMCQQIIAQVNGVCPVEMFPAQGAQAGFSFTANPSVIT